MSLRAKHNEAADLVAQMTLEEKARFCSGRSFWHLEALPRLGIPRVMVTDGPHGLRKQSRDADHVGLNVSVPATCFPTACALASSWDVDLLKEVGIALGRESAAEKVAVLLGPGINIKRHPLCGRNFEYYSEDPLLSGELAAAFIDGVQSQGVGTSLKHFAVNNQEHGRMTVDAIVDERTLREIYLKGFEIAVEKSQPWTVMCAYNRVNGSYCGENDWLLNQVLRNEWGFEGLVVSDWGATNDRVAGLEAGLDLEMPGGSGANDARIQAAVESGRLAEGVLDRAVTRNVAVSLLGGELAGTEQSVDPEAHHALARRVAAESAVLLRNEGGLLPLGEPIAGNLAVIGAFAKKPRYQGTGSSQVKPTRLDCAYDALTEALGYEPAYAAGYDPRMSEPDAALIEEACAVARGADAVVVFAGLPGIYESEGFDRAHLGLPEQHDRLIEAVHRENANVVVVLANGGPVLMPWADDVPAILEGYLGGQAGGSGIVDVLLGAVNPSGRLAESFPIEQTAVAADAWFPGENRQVQYREGVYVGYRQPDLKVRFPFGFGLSYTTFAYEDFQVTPEISGPDETVRVRLTVSNTGNREGRDVVQIYVSDRESRVYRPEAELKAFVKVGLMPGEAKTVSFDLDRSAFEFFDVTQGAWVVEAGEFEIRAGASSADIRGVAGVVIRDGDPVEVPAGAGPEVADGRIKVDDDRFAGMLGRPVPPPEGSRPFHLNSSVDEIAVTWLGRRVRDRIVAGFREQMGGARNDEVLKRMFETMAGEMPLRALELFGGGQLSRAQIDILLALLNRRPIMAARLYLADRKRRQEQDSQED